MAAEQSASRSRLALQALVLVAAVLLAYQPVWQAGFIWDDDVYVTHNRLLTAPDGLKRIWFSLDSPSQYFPLVYTVLRLERTAWGLASGGYHWVNILLHAANALLLWGLLRRWRLPAAWLAAAFFALHPVEVESVAWVTELKNVLSLFFCLLTAWAWVEFAGERPKAADKVARASSPASSAGVSPVDAPAPGGGTPPKPADERCGRWGFYLAALLFQALALFAKTTACTLPAALLLILWLRGERIGWRRAWQIAPFFAMGLMMGLVSVWWERHHQFAVGDAFAIGWVSRLLIASRAVWFYAGKLLWPVDLSFSYPRWQIDPGDWCQYLWLAACIAAGVAIRAAGRGVKTGLLIFVATLAPLLGFIMQYALRYSFVADHYQYAASIGLLALAAAGIDRLLGRFEAGRPALRPLVYALLPALLGLLTWRQCRNYADSETLWRATLRSAPNASIARNNLSQALLDKGKLDEAMRLSAEVLAVNPKDAVAQNNLGFALLEKGRVEEAMSHLQAAIAAQPNAPDAYYNLGRAWLKKEQFQSAIANFQMAVRLRPDFANAWCNLGFASLRAGRLPEAVAHYEKALALAPDYPLAHNDLGGILLRLGQTNQAMTHFQRAAELAPDFVEAHYNLGGLLLAAGRLDEALRQYETVAQQRPRLAEAHFMLGRLAAAYARSGRLDRAVTVTTRALQLARAAGETSLADSLAAQLHSYGKGD
jgi:tetratricopeptide (TPR) repeat protein